MRRDRSRGRGATIRASLPRVEMYFCLVAEQGMIQQPTKVACQVHRKRHPVGRGYASRPSLGTPSAFQEQSRSQALAAASA